MNKIHQKYEVSVGAGVTPRSDRSGEAFSYVIPHTSGVKLWTFHVISCLCFSQCCDHQSESFDSIIFDGERTEKTLKKSAKQLIEISLAC